MILFLDACVVIYWIEAPSPFHGRLMARLRALRQQDPEATFAVSRLSWMKCMVEPLLDDHKALADDYRAFLDARQLVVVELTAAVIERAAALRAGKGLKTPDALQAASALTLEGEVLFLTNDRRFSRVPDLKVDIPV